MNGPPTIGQRVRLNPTGMRQIGGLTSWEMTEQARAMRVVDVEQMGPSVWAVEVDQPLINMFLLNNNDVDAL
jgi:hypothetical protein